MHPEQLQSRRTHAFHSEGVRAASFTRCSATLTTATAVALRASYKCERSFLHAVTVITDAFYVVSRRHRAGRRCHLRSLMLVGSRSETCTLGASCVTPTPRPSATQKKHPTQNEKPNNRQPTSRRCE